MSNKSNQLSKHEACEHDEMNACQRFGQTTVTLDTAAYLTEVEKSG